MVLEFRVWGLGFKGLGFEGFGLNGLGLWVWGLEFSVLGLGFNCLGFGPCRDPEGNPDRYLFGHVEQHYPVNNLASSFWGGYV